MDKKDLFSESDPFYCVYRKNTDGTDTLVYRSEWIKVGGSSDQDLNLKHPKAESFDSSLIENLNHKPKKYHSLAKQNPEPILSISSNILGLRDITFGLNYIQSSELCLTVRLSV